LVLILLKRSKHIFLLIGRRMEALSKTDTVVIQKKIM
jgi:hypothetical protein